MVIQEFVSTFRFAMRWDQYRLIKKAFNSLQKTMKATQTMSRFWMIAGIGAASAVLVDFGLQTARAIDKLGDLGDKLGITAQQMQEWKYAAQQASVDISSFEIAIKQLGRNIGDAASGKAPKVLQRFAELAKILGKSTTDMIGQGQNPKHWSETFLDMADAFSQMSEEQKKGQLAYALKLMGRTGEEMVQMLNMGSDHIRTMFEDIRRFGHEITVEERERANKSIKQWDTIKAKFTALGQELFASIQPLFEGFMDTLEDIATAMIWLARKFGEGTKKISDYFHGIGLDARRFGWILKFLLAPVMLSTILLVAKLARAVGLTAGGMATVFARVVLPVTLLAIALALIGDEIAVALKGGKTLTGEIYKWANDIDPEDNGVVSMLKSAIRLASELGTLLAGMLSGNGNIIEMAFKGIIAGITAIFMDASRMIMDTVFLMARALAIVTPGGVYADNAVKRLQAQFDAFSAAAKRDMYRDFTGYDPTTGRPAIGEVKNNVKIDVHVGPGVSPREVGRAVGDAVTSEMPNVALGSSHQALF